MTVERTLRLIAGLFVLISLALGHWVNQYWYLFTAFVGLNLLSKKLRCRTSAFLMTSLTNRRRLQSPR